MRSLVALLVPALALSLGAFACSGADSEEPIGDPEPTNEVQSQLVDEGHECSAEHKCKPGLVCVARVQGGDVGIKGVPCIDCGQTSSSSSSSSSTGGSTTSSTGGWSSSSSSSGDWGSTSSSTGGWGSTSSSTGGWSSSSSSGGVGSSSSSSSSSGATPEVGVCITIH